MAVEDATVADVTGRHRANATVFNRIAQALAQDVVAVLPTAGADDPDGCEAAASAVHRSVASGAAAGDVAGATRRVEQGLRRLGTAIDKTSPAAACETHELLEMLATYVQAGTMLARTKAQNRDEGRAGERLQKMEVEALVQSETSPMDEVQSERASRATWRLADALAPLDPRVAVAAPDAPAVAASALACVKRALTALPTDHLHPLFPESRDGPTGDASFPGLDGDPVIRSTVDAIANELAREYALRKETVARRGRGRDAGAGTRRIAGHRTVGNPRRRATRQSRRPRAVRPPDQRRGAPHARRVGEAGAHRERARPRGTDGGGEGRARGEHACVHRSR